MNVWIINKELIKEDFSRYEAKKLYESLIKKEQNG